MTFDHFRRIAAIDIGTVTMRLLIADVGIDTIAEVERSTDIVHLGEGLTQSGRLSAGAIERVTKVVADYAAKIDQSKVDTVRAVATSAARDAGNGEMLSSAVRSSGIPLTIIDGDKEATLSFLGATWGLTDARVLLNDIGGGSTELVLGRAALSEAFAASDSRGIEIEFARSIDVGSRRITEMFLRSDPPASGELRRAREYIVSELSPFFERDLESPDVLISVAGTATSLSAIRQGLAVYDLAKVHHSRLARDDVSAMLDQLSGMTVSERRQVRGLHPGRAPVIAAGTLVLDSIMELAGMEHTTVSEHDILYGILLEDPNC